MSRGGSARFGNTQAPHTVPQCVAWHAEAGCRLREIATGGLESLNDVLALDGVDGAIQGFRHVGNALSGRQSGAERLSRLQHQHARGDLGLIG